VALVGTWHPARVNSPQAHNLNSFRTESLAKQVLYQFTHCCSDGSVGAASWDRWHRSYLTEVMIF